MRNILFITYFTLFIQIFSYSQRNLDLSVKIVNPTEGQEFPNLDPLDPFNIQLQISNQGADAIHPTDSLFVVVEGIAEDIYDGARTAQIIYTGISIPSGGSTTLNHVYKQGEFLYAFTDPGGYFYVFAKFPDDALDTMKVGIFALDEEGYLLVETDFPPAEPDGTYGLGANNKATVHYEFSADAVSIGKTLIPIAINLYPNPTTDEIHFSFNLESRSASIAQIFDLNGRLILTKDFGYINSGLQNFTVNTSELPSGNYLLKFTAADLRGISKFIIKR